MQNTLNDPAVCRRLKASHGFGWSAKDDGYYRKNTGTDLSGPVKCVQRAKRKFGWPVCDVYLEALASIEGRMTRIAREYVGMPFARLHYDLREDNVVGKPQRLADWGSSYGQGMFMYDVAIHIGGDAQARKAFVETSDICRKASERDVAGWLWLATCIRLTEKAWAMDPNQSWMKRDPAGCRRGIERFKWLPRLVLDRPAKVG
jgi:Ser/Thr protein kinase RdoA (MazF antagonist)